MYHSVIAQCTESLRLMVSWLDTATEYAADKGFDVNVLMDCRLAPDMQPFTYQISSASDYVKAGAGYLAGQTPPRYLDNERTLEEVRERIEKTVAFANTIPASAYADADARIVSVPWMPGKVIRAPDYLTQIIVPNAYFHIGMAYAILRHNGVPLSKEDFLGELRFIDPDQAAVAVREQVR